MNPKYITITIGPIVETLLAAQKTRELWAASYFLSYLARKLTAAFAGDGKDTVKVLLPATDLLEAPNHYGAGLYPDRIYLEILPENSEKAFTVVQDICERVINQIAADMHKDLTENSKPGKESISPNPFTKSDCRNCLRSYLKLYASELEISDEENIVFALSNRADMLDQQPRILPVRTVVTNTDHGPAAFPVDKEGRSPMQRLFFLANWSFLFKDGFQRGEGIPHKRAFDSMIEVGSRELAAFDPEAYKQIIQEEIVQKADGDEQVTLEPDEEAIISKFRERIKAANGRTRLQDYHKYVAIVHADGDNIGKIIAAIGKETSKILDFSKDLLEFASDATRIVTEYGGAPIYMGGDDMLFLAPVCNPTSGDASKRQHVFQLIRDLDQRFSILANKYREAIEDYYEKEATPQEKRFFPTISYGMSIAFYKYPLYESKNMSYDLLNQVKKNHEGKNAVKVALHKHSGHLIQFTIPKDAGTGVWDGFIDFLDKRNTNGSFLNSFTYKLETVRPIIERIATDPVRLKQFFRNNFNENYNSNKPFYDSLADFIAVIYAHHKGKFAHDLLYGALRFVHFIHNPQIQSRVATV